MPTFENVATSSMRPVTPLSANISSSVVKHHKPFSAVDGISEDSFNSTPIIIGSIIGVVSISVIVALVYKKFKDVWSRRHYDRMDFLIEGMYDL